MSLARDKAARLGRAADRARPEAADGFGGLRSAVIESGAAQAALQPWIAMECYQLSRGKRLSQMDSLDLGPVQVVREQQFAAIHKLGATPADLCTLSYCVPGAECDGPQDATFRFTDHGATSPDTVFFMPERTEFDIHVPEGAQTAYLSFSQSAFLAAAQALRPEAWDKAPGDVVQFHSTRLGELRAAVDQWIDAALAAQMAGGPLDPAVMHAIVLQTALQVAMPEETPTPPAPATRSRALRLCRMARDYVEAELDAHAVPTIVDICMTLSVSERTLLYAFHDYVGMSPQAYLRRCRLNRVRTALLAAQPQDTTVTGVAMAFGFLHLGRFAGDYRQIFDESPGTTLARRM